MEMEIKKDIKSSRKYTVPVNPALFASQFFESYLEKKARNLFSGWQKRYFRCIEGKIIIYTDTKESKQVKGYLQIKKIIEVKSVDSKSFSIESDERQYTLKADNEALKNKWIQTINILLDNIKQKASKSTDLSFDFNKSVDIQKKNKNNGNDKVKTISKKTADLLKKYGYIIYKEDPHNKQLLEKTGISKLINLNDPKVLMRIHYGFMFKKQKNHDIFNKRWFFLFSARPLFNDNYFKDDYDLSQKKQKDWLYFDVLYYFKTDTSENIYDNKIELESCHKIINFEKDGKFFMNLDAGDRAYDLYCETKSERDEWFEVIKNSRKTAKEYKLSITKHPRNVDLLSNLYLKDQKEFTKTLQDEKVSLVGNVNELSEFNIFEFTINNFQFRILSTLDGCLCCVPNKLDLLKAYAEYMNKEYIDIFKIYWEKCYDKLSNEEILKMSFMLLNFYESLIKLNIDDENLLKNSKEFVKIFYKKIFQNILSVIENILKNEREFKGNKNEQGIYYTLGPKDLFDTLSQTFDLVKEYKHPVIYKELLKIFNVSISQYVIGVNCVISNHDIIIDNEYLISVANNSYYIIELMNTLLDRIRKTDCLNEKQINEEIQLNKIMNSINKLTYNSIVRFVYGNKDELWKDFDKVKFFDVNLENIILKTGEIFGKYKSMMIDPVIKKTWNEILKLTLCYYITSLLLTPDKKKRKLDEFKSKIENDKKYLFETYSRTVGENLTNTTLKILDDILNFLSVSQCMISTSCLSIRQYIGPAFAYSAAKKLVKLRTDLSKEEKKDCKKQCEDVLNNYTSQKNEDSSYFHLLREKIKKNDKDQRLSKRLYKEKYGNQIIEKDNEENKNS